ncbi:Transposase [Phytophthora megakarya]|uniref:Transposase n=1 Tax=Phytophthora megakarya TaxID=4795 RepID=A0A225UQ81_9STRA|nr:Transposase [Phytophthora megakarya]
MTFTRGHSSVLWPFGNIEFFVFIPISFWKQILVFTNEYAAASGTPSPTDVVLEELMKFLGILWYMTLFDRGEMRNYWTDNEEASIFPGACSTSMDSIMSWTRFIYIRKHLSFRSGVTVENVQRDPAARIRPLISACAMSILGHVNLGRNIAIDEASIACLSQFARRIIVFNPRKPTGKYHFKFNIVLLQKLTEKSSEIRSHVLELTASLHGSRRIVNTDNFYTSCLLLESLRAVGMFGRGTVRGGSTHFPRFTMISEKDKKPRGFMKQGVCVENHIVAASWVDGSIVFPSRGAFISKVAQEASNGNDRHSQM